VVDVSSASECSDAYHKEASKPAKPFLCNTARIHIRGKTNIKSAIKVIPVLFNSEGGSGRVLEDYPEITLDVTDQKDGDWFLTKWHSCDVGPDDIGHLFVSSMGTATEVLLETRRD
jgi:hypothetical protein